MVTSQEEEKKCFHWDSSTQDARHLRFWNYTVAQRSVEAPPARSGTVVGKRKPDRATCRPFGDHSVAQKLNDLSPSGKLGDEASRSVTE